MSRSRRSGSAHIVSIIPLAYERGKQSTGPTETRAHVECIFEYRANKTVIVNPAECGVYAAVRDPLSNKVPFRLSRIMSRPSREFHETYISSEYKSSFEEVGFNTV